MSVVKTDDLMSRHEAEASNFIDYHGFSVPAFYHSSESELDAAIHGVALIDRSWLGRVEIKGADRIDLLHRLSTNDLLKTQPGDVVGTVFTSDKGRVIDYVTLVVAESSILALTSPGMDERIRSWVETYCIMEDVSVSCGSSSTAVISLAGPRSPDILSTALNLDLHPNKCGEIRHASMEARVARRRDDGTDIVDLVVDAEHFNRWWNYVSNIGREYGMVKMGALAYEAFRISRGFPQVGHEISEEYNPFEIGLQRAISFTKGCYIGQEVIARLDTYQKVRRQLVGLSTEGPSESSVAGATVIGDSSDIGILTSVSPMMIRNKTIGLAIVRKDSVRSGETVSLKKGAHTTEATISDLPIQI